MRTYTEEEVNALMALATAVEEAGDLSQTAHQAAVDASFAAMNTEDRELRDMMRGAASSASEIMHAADRLQAQLNEIRRRVQA